MLGDGASAKVYLYKYKNRKVAVKIQELKYDENGQDIETETEAEYAILKDLNHLNIIKPIDLYYTEETVNEILPLYEYNLYEYKFKDMFEKKLMMKQLSNAVHYLHENKIMHRDIKPDNILISNSFFTVLIDFGLSKYKEDINTPKMCTVNYRAPEVCYTKTYNEKCDIFSLGCVFYFILTGKELFNTDTNYQQFNSCIQILGNKEITLGHMKINYHPSSLKNYCTSLNKKQYHLLKNMLHFNPDKRFNIYDVINHDYIKSLY
jgi:serine/threonine protein kinase